MDRMPTATGRGSAASTTIAVAALVLSLLFVVLASVRRLNFDEALALHSGWLMAQSVPARPAFGMPFTWMLGVLASAVDDPGAVFLVARLVTVGSVLVALVAFSWRLFGESRSSHLFLAVVLSNGLFVTHGLEFRYDAVLLVAWLLLAAVTLGARRLRWEPLILGALIGLLALHHLKGAYFAGWAYVLALVHLAAPSTGRVRRLATLHGTIVGTWLSWLAVAAVVGALGDVVGLFEQFWALSRGTTRSDGPAVFVIEVLSVDLAWWLAAAALGTWGVWAGRARRGRMLWLAAYGSVPLSFALLHPMPWVYMVVPAVPFVGAILVGGIQSSFRRFGLTGAVLPISLFVALQWALLGTHPWSAYIDGFRADRSTQVTAMRYLRAEADPQERVLDPSGLAYFLVPSSTEWYIDGLFAEAHRSGEWMRSDQVEQMLDADWVVYSYRLDQLPVTVNSVVRERFAPASVGVGVRVDRDEPRPARVPLVPLPSFWARRGAFEMDP
jgi:hypothetical protein